MEQREFLEGIAKWQATARETMRTRALAAAAAQLGVEVPAPVLVAPSKSVAKRVAAQKQHRMEIVVGDNSAGDGVNVVVKRKATPTTHANAVVDHAAPTGSASDRVLAAIRTTAGHSAKTLAASLGLGESTVANVLTALVRSGAVARVGGGIYAIGTGAKAVSR